MWGDGVARVRGPCGPHGRAARHRAALVAACALAGGCGARGGVPRNTADTVAAALRAGPVIRIDGDVADWREPGGASPGVTATRTAAGSEEPGGIRITDDAGSVYFLLDLPEPVNLQGLEGALVLVLDADGDPGTGEPVLGVPGTDVLISFTRLVGGEVRHGVATWPPSPTEPDRIAVPPDASDPYALGLWFEPRHTTDRVEIRLSRAARLPGGGRDLLRGTRLGGRLVRVDATGHEIARGEPFAHPLSPAAPELSPDDPAWPVARAGVEAVRRSPGTDVRVASWNVSRTRLLSDPGPVQRILAALDPDLVLLDEVPPEATREEILALLPPSSEGPPWTVHLGTGGSGQRGVVAVRGSVRAAPELARLPYPDSVLPWLDAPASADLAEVRRDVEGGGIPATGAWVEVADRRLLVATVDLVCCGNARTAVEDRIRRVEADVVNRALRGALERAVAAGRAPNLVLFGGDFNLVGSPEPLAIAGRGLGRDGAALVAVDVLQLDGASNATWDNGSGPFPPGRLDYVLYDEARASVVGSFVFESRDLADAALTELGLAAVDGERASDHRPVVVDFAWR